MVWNQTCNLSEVCPSLSLWAVAWRTLQILDNCIPCVNYYLTLFNQVFIVHFVPGTVTSFGHWSALLLWAFFHPIMIKWHKTSYTPFGIPGLSGTQAPCLYPVDNETGFPSGSMVKNPPANAGDRHRFKLQIGKISRRRKWQPTLVFLPGKS